MFLSEHELQKGVGTLRIKELIIFVACQKTLFCRKFIFIIYKTLYFVEKLFLFRGDLALLYIVI